MGKYYLKLSEKRDAVHKKIAKGENLSREDELILLDEKKENHDNINFKDFQVLIEIGEEFVFTFRGKKFEIIRPGPCEEIEFYKEIDSANVICEFFPNEESFLSHANIEGFPIKEIVKEFVL